MKNVILIFYAILIASISMAQEPLFIFNKPTSGSNTITYVSSPTGINGGSATTTSALSFSPANGDWVVLSLKTGSGATSAACTDNNSNSFSASSPASVTQSTMKIWEFYYTATGSPSSFTCTWTTNATWALSAASYHDTGTGSVNNAPASNTANATSTNPSVSPTSTVAGQFMTAACGNAGSTTWSAQTGNLRTSSSASVNGSSAIIDNTGSSGSSITESATLGSSLAWACVAIELKP